MKGAAARDGRSVATSGDPGASLWGRGQAVAAAGDSRGDNPPVLRAEGLVYRYPRADHDALGPIDLEASGGEVLAILGPNGSGKSTLLSLLAGILNPRVGRVVLHHETSAACGMEDVGAANDQRPLPPMPRGRRVAWLPQIERLSFSLSVFDYALLGRLPHVGLFGMPGAADRDKVAAALAATGLDALAERPVNELSGGELQLARIARCLAQETAVVVLDEPAAMLDPANALAIADALCALAATGRIMICSSHDPAFAAHVAHRAILLRHGKLLACGPAAEILKPRHLEETFGVPFGLAGGLSPFGGDGAG